MNGRLLLVILFFSSGIAAQNNLLLNGNFEDINTCTEYKSECGVEGWFYLKDVQAQMLSNDDQLKDLGNNSFATFFNWRGYTEFSPLIGTILPCGLVAGNEYIFRGLINAKINNRLLLKPGIAIGDKFFVPRRNFTTIKPDSITTITAVEGTNFFQFEYHFKATGNEEYLTFGTYIREDNTGAKRALIGVQTVALTLDNFELVTANGKVPLCDDYDTNKKMIYAYDFRHKEMDYSLFGKGKINVVIKRDKPYFESTRAPVKIPKSDTLELTDILFDFNKSDLKPAAITLLKNYFETPASGGIDSIRIEGHTDSVGSDERNIILSQARSNSVMKWLAGHVAIDTTMINIIGFGRRRPKTSNATAAGRAINRRVEIIIWKKEE